MSTLITARSTPSSGSSGSSGKELRTTPAPQHTATDAEASR